MERTAEEKKQDEESRACAIAMAKIAWDTKAEDVTVLHVAPVVYWCSYMVFATIKSRPQMQAVVAKIEQKAEQEWNRPISQLAKTSRSPTPSPPSFITCIALCVFIMMMMFVN